MMSSVVYVVVAGVIVWVVFPAVGFIVLVPGSSLSLVTAPRGSGTSYRLAALQQPRSVNDVTSASEGIRLAGGPGSLPLEPGMGRPSDRAALKTSKLIMKTTMRILELAMFFAGD